MAEICGWSDCKSSEMQPHAVTHQCLTCGRHSMQGAPVVWVMGETSRWEPAQPVPLATEGQPDDGLGTGYTADRVRALLAEEGQ